MISYLNQENIVMLVVVPLLIYCLLKSIRVNIPHLIIDFMLSNHLLIPTRNSTYAMIFTHLFKYFKINLSDERVVNPSFDIIAPF